MSTVYVGGKLAGVGGESSDVVQLAPKMIHRFAVTDANGNPQNTGRYDGLHLDFDGTPPSIDSFSPTGQAASLYFDGEEKAAFENPTELPFDDSRSWLLQSKVYIPDGGALWMMQRSSDGDSYSANGHKMVYLSQTRINWSGYGEGDFWNDFPFDIAGAWVEPAIAYDRNQNELVFLLNGEVLGYHSVTMRGHNTGDGVYLGTTNSGWMSGKSAYMADLQYKEW